jgi:ElaB/YqjD/DUF883 family membrane-anchored ribosome-binding protein
MSKRPNGRRARAMAAEVTDAARERAEEAIEAAEEALEAAYEAAEDGIDEAHQYIRRQWRERPLAVAGAALGVGLILGVLLSGGRR